MRLVQPKARGLRRHRSRSVELQWCQTLILARDGPRPTGSRAIVATHRRRGNGPGSCAPLRRRLGRWGRWQGVLPQHAIVVALGVDEQQRNGAHVRQLVAHAEARHVQLITGWDRVL